MLFAPHNPYQPLCAIGLMSGTSVDAIDACAVSLCLRDGQLDWTLRATATRPFEPALRARLLAVMNGEPHAASVFCALNAELGEAFAQAALAVMALGGLRADDVAVIGSHGQTVSHLPPGSGSVAATLQLGDAAMIAERTGILTIADFRPRDMAAGGQGAPLVPLADRWLFQRPDQGCAMQNIGGMGNLTVLPPGASGRALRAWDTGPGNVLMDAAMRRFYHMPMDRDGEAAARGVRDASLWRALLNDTEMRLFLDMPPPKSTGRERFGEALLDRVLAACPEPPAPDDVLATLTEWTAHTMAQSLARWTAPEDDVRTLILGGGGAKNPTLRRLLTEALAAHSCPVLLRTHADYGIPDAYKEALAFALLAWATCCGAAGNVPSCTGARHAVVLGSATWGGPPVRVLE